MSLCFCLLFVNVIVVSQWHLQKKDIPLVTENLHILFLHVLSYGIWVIHVVIQQCYSTMVISPGVYCSSCETCNIFTAYNQLSIGIVCGHRRLCSQCSKAYNTIVPARGIMECRALMYRNSKYNCGWTRLHVRIKFTRSWTFFIFQVLSDNLQLSFNQHLVARTDLTIGVLVRKFRAWV